MVSFSDRLTEEFEYLSIQAEEDPASGTLDKTESDLVTKSLSKKSNTSILNSKNNPVGNFGELYLASKHKKRNPTKHTVFAGGLGSYTPSKMGDTASSFQLGVSRLPTGGEGQRGGGGSKAGSKATVNTSSTKAGGGPSAPTRKSKTTQV